MSALKIFGRQLISIAAYYSGYCLLSEHLRTGIGARILCYHGITENPTNPYAISAKNFLTQMQFLVENYQIVSIEQFVKFLQGKKPISPNIIAISIDDGFQDIYFYGFPVLKQYSIPATIFLSTGLIDRNQLNEKNRVLSQNKFLEWDQIREMSQNGIEIGSHSVNHVSLTKLTQQQVEYELNHSKSRLETETGKEITGFAYPYGTFRDISLEIEQTLRELGYSWAVTSISGINKNGTNNFFLKRTMVERYDGIAGFKRVLRGSLDAWILMQKLGRYL